MVDERHNENITALTQVFNERVPTLSEIHQVGSQMKKTNMFAVMHGAKPGPGAYELLRANRAADIQQRIAVQNAFLNTARHEYAVAKLMSEEQRYALDMARDQAQMGHEATGRVYSELLKVLPKLDSASASRLMQSILNDPEDVAVLQGAMSGEEFLVRNMAAAGIKYREKKKGGVTSKEPVKQKYQAKSVVDIENDRVVRVDNLGNVSVEKLSNPEDRIVATPDKTPTVTMEQLKALSKGSGPKKTGSVSVTPDELEIEIENPKRSLATKIMGLFD